MARGYEFRFRIDVYTLDTLPMARLAEYMTDLATILGEKKSVHFVRLEAGSATLVQRIDDPAIPKVRQRVIQVQSGEAPPEAMAAYRSVNRRLKQDDAVGELIEETGAKIISFPGREQAETATFGAFNQSGVLDGVVILIGGTRDPVPVHLEAASVRYNCHANRDLAKALGHYLFGPEIRASGQGRWLRDENGEWVLERFTISSFEVLREEPLSAVVARLRDVPGSEWTELDDPWGELDRIRNGPDEAN